MKIVSLLAYIALGLCAAFMDTAGAQPLTVTTIAGQFGVQDFTGAQAVGVGTQAHFDYPGQLHADQAGNLYVCDADCIKKISPGLSVTVLAGHLGIAPGDYGYLDGKGTNALFNNPTDCAIDTNGTVYVVDNRNFVIRKISSTGAVTTFAGNGHSVYIDATGTNAGFTGPIGIAIDSAGNFYVSDLDSNGNRIRKISPAGVVSTLAGGPYNYQDGDGVGTNAQFVYPNGLAVDAAGTVYVADEHSIRKITPDGTVTTWAGDRSNNFKDSDGLGLNAEFNGASEIALDRSGGLYVVDSTGPTIRYVSAAGAVSTVAGAVGQYPAGSNNGVGSGALFDSPAGISVGIGGNVYLTDLGASTILEGVPPTLATFGSVSESAGVAPIRSNNPWQFTAVFTNIVSDLRMRVQSTATPNIEASWTDLPGNVDITDVGGNWTFNTTDVPAGTQYFRVAASAPGYFDSASAAVGPETVLQGIAQFGQFTEQTKTPYHSGTSWTFNIVETSVISGLGLRVQSSADGNNWNDLPDGQMSTSDSVNWAVTSFTVPTGTISFRVVASAPTYTDMISDPSVPFTIVAGLPDIDSFLLTTGGTPVRSSNPWQFLAAYTDLVPGLQLRVQSTSTTNDDGSWQDLPGIHYMTNNAPGWTLAKTDVPTGVQYFRVVASAPGYVDGVSVTVGPQTVLQGFDLWGYFSYSTAAPNTTATPWAFVIGQTSQIPGMSLRVQSSSTPDDDNSWSNLPGGGQMTLLPDGINWGIFTTNVPVGAAVSFRVVASAPDYVDLVSADLGAFDIEAPLPVFINTITTGGTYTLQDFGGSVMSIFHAVGAVVNFVVTGAATTIQGAITLTADVGSSIAMTINKGQVVKVAGLNVQAHSTVLVSGTIDGPVSVGIVASGAGNIVASGAGNVVSNDGGSLAQDAETAALAALIAQDGGSIVASGAGNVIGVNGSAVAGGKSKGNSPAGGPLQPKPGDQTPTQPTFTGQMTINGNYSQFPGTALIIGIAGTNTLDEGAQQFDQLVVNGHVNFAGGTIEFVLLDPNDQTNPANAFQPPVGATFDVVVASNIVVGTVHIFGPIWGDGLFFSGSVVIRDDGLQAVRLTATHIPPQIFLQNVGSGLHLVYGTNYTGYAVENSPDLVNWSEFSIGTNVVQLNPGDAGQFFRLSHP